MGMFCFRVTKFLFVLLFLKGSKLVQIGLILFYDWNRKKEGDSLIFQGKEEEFLLEQVV